MTVPPSLMSVLSQDPQVMSGAICFHGTRVPLQALMDTVEDGHGIYEFLDGFPDVTFEQAQAVVKWQQALTAQALQGRQATH